jgi:polyisoprenoid-binding protein YceI
MRPRHTNRAAPCRRIVVANLVWFLLLFPLPAAAGGGEALLIFTRDGATSVGQAFETTYLPKIEALALEMGVPVRRVALDGQSQTPQGVAITPLLVYQNHRGRSIFQGRYTALGRIRTFLRTARHVDQAQVADRRGPMAVWAMGQSRVWSPIKVSAVTGTPPDGHDAKAFQREAHEAIIGGLPNYAVIPEVNLRRTDRGFYMDFYPWRAADGTLFLSLALYSQFDCKAPIFVTGEKPLVGPWAKRRELFARAATILEGEVAAAVAEAQRGDGFDPLPADVAEVAWAKLGLALPPAPVKQTTQAEIPGEIPKRWVLTKPDADAPPLIQFHFPAPLDHYRGEVTAAEGQLELGADKAMAGAKGAVHVDTRSAVTMGDPILDEALGGQALLGARQHPRATYQLSSASGDGQPLAFGRLSPARLDGTFHLKGVAIPLALVADVEPVIGRNGQIQLLVRTAFEIDLRRFAIEGADGPAPQRDTVRFDLNLVFNSAGQD